MIATDLWSGETSTTDMKVPCGLSRGSGGRTRITTLKLLCDYGEIDDYYEN